MYKVKANEFEFSFTKEQTDAADLVKKSSAEFNLLYNYRSVNAKIVAPSAVALAEKMYTDSMGMQDYPVPQEMTEAVLKQGLEKGVAELVFEVERVRMNEAALVSGANPELDAVQAAQKNKTERKVLLRDAALQRAVDFITTLAIYERAKAPR